MIWVEIGAAWDINKKHKIPDSLLGLGNFFSLHICKQLLFLQQLMLVGFFPPPYAKAWFEPKVTPDWDLLSILTELQNCGGHGNLKKFFFSITADFMPSARFLFLVLILMFLGHQFLSLTCRNAKVRFIRAFTNSCLTVFSAVPQSRDYEKKSAWQGSVWEQAWGPHVSASKILRLFNAP